MEKLFVPPGHYYSPVVNVSELAPRAEKLFDRAVKDLPGVDLRDDAQVALFKRLIGRAVDLPFKDSPANGLRYGYENDAFSHGDGAFMALMLMDLAPTRIIEVGSGHSSALMLDVSEHLLNRPAEFTFIEPHLDVLNRLLSDADKSQHRIIAQPVQDAPLELFRELEPGDFLFIDTTHIVKTGSDVVHHLFDVLPALKPGVMVAIHDVFYPFEYLKHWVMEDNRSWNELYVLRAFLTNNAEWRVLFFNDYFAIAHWDLVTTHLPPMQINPGGTLWLEKQAL